MEKLFGSKPVTGWTNEQHYLLDKLMSTTPTTTTTTTGTGYSESVSSTMDKIKDLLRTSSSSTPHQYESSLSTPSSSSPGYFTQKYDELKEKLVGSDITRAYLN